MLADPAHSLQERLYRTIRLIRRFEERAIELVRVRRDRRRHPPVHRAGGDRRRRVRGRCGPDDIITEHPPRPRPRAGQGRRPGRMLAELPGRVTGLNRGRGGSMHAADLRLGVYGATDIVGHGAAIATGVAWAGRPGRNRPGGRQLLRRRRGQPGRAAGVAQPGRALAGAGAVRLREQRLRHHACRSRTRSPARITGRAAAFGIPAVHRRRHGPGGGARGGHARPSTGPAPAAGPTLLECLTYRFDAHHTFEHKVRLRLPHARTRWPAGARRDPLDIQGAPDRGDVRRDGSTPRSRRCSTTAVRFALASPKPDPADALDYLYATGPARRPGWPAADVGRWRCPGCPTSRRSTGRSATRWSATRRCSCSARTSRWRVTNVTAGLLDALRAGAGARHAAVRAGRSPASPPARRWPAGGR